MRIPGRYLKKLMLCGAAVTAKEGRKEGISKGMKERGKEGGKINNRGVTELVTD